MKFNRRQLLAGAAALSAEPLMGRDAKAWFPHGQQLIGHGWNTLPLGAGGLVTGMCIAPDGTAVCRTDVGGIYKWSGVASLAGVTDPSQKWEQLFNYASLGSAANINVSVGAWEFVIAPSKTTNFYAIFPDINKLNKYWLYYSTNSGGTWTQTTLTFLNADSNIHSGFNTPNASYKIAVDPANEQVVYVGMPISSGTGFGVWRSIDGTTFSALSTGTIGVDTTYGIGTCGICFDPSSGTVLVGGQTRTARVIIPVGGVGIFESTDGGVTFTEVAAVAIGSTNITVWNGRMNSQGVYYAVVVSSVTAAQKIWRYSGAGGTWTNIDPTGTYSGLSISLATDPRAGHEGFLLVSGANGIGNGYVSSNANTGSPPTWTGSTSGQNPVLQAASYDLPYLNFIFGQGAGTFAFATAAFIDANGMFWWCGNQSIWYMMDSTNTTPAIPNYPNGTGPYFTYSWSWGRGQEATVAQEAWRFTGGTYPVLGPQDFGNVIGNTFIKGPTDYTPRFKEYTCSSIEESPTDGTFGAIRLTGQGGVTYDAVAGDSSSYTTNAGATWTPYNSFPGTTCWHAGVTASSSGTTLTVTAITPGDTVFIGQFVYPTGVFASVPWVTGQLSGTPGGIGTYSLSSTLTAASQSMDLYAENVAGQIFLADNDHHIVIAAGHSHGTIPAYTANRGNSWAICGGLPGGNWMAIAWFNAASAKPIATGFGTDVGTVWAAFKTSSTVVTVYKSTDFGATFTPTLNTVTVASGTSSLYLLAVPGHTGHLWLTGGASSGIWQSTDSGDTWTSKTMPNSKAGYFSIGAIDPVSGTYPTLWMSATVNNNPSQKNILYYSINGATSWSVLGSSGIGGVSADLPAAEQMYGISTVRADRQIFKRLYCGAGQTGFVYYNP